jgi:hypothetical protein
MSDLRWHCSALVKILLICDGLSALGRSGRSILWRLLVILRRISESLSGARASEKGLLLPRALSVFLSLHDLVLLVLLVLLDL